MRVLVRVSNEGLTSLVKGIGNASSVWLADVAKRRETTVIPKIAAATASNATEIDVLEGTVLEAERPAAIVITNSETASGVLPNDQR
jgi:hypothetical protein